MAKSTLLIILKAFKCSDTEIHLKFSCSVTRVVSQPNFALLILFFDKIIQKGNQDWLLLAIETLLLREHNRLCDILIAQYPHWDDETLYQFARVGMSVKYQMIANNYQQAYFTEEMPHPWVDGVPLFRQWHGTNFFQ